MSGPGACFVFMSVCLVVLSGQSSASFWRPTSLPSNPNDPYYQKFQKVPSENVTATKFMRNFLRFTSRTPVAKRQSVIEDIVVVMDSSGSIGSCQFGIGKKALKNMMDVAGNDKTYDARYAGVTFSTSAIVNFMFLHHLSAANEIMKIPYLGGSTNTQAGLVEAKKLFDSPSSGRRNNANKIVLLVTDGQSNDNKHLTIPKAQELKNSGARIFVVAVGSYLQGIDEIVKVASYPPEYYTFRVSNLRGFWEVIKLIIKEVSPDKYIVINGQNPSCPSG